MLLGVHKVHTMIFLVIGFCGEHDSSREWVVCYYKTRRKAEKYAGMAEGEANKLYRKHAKLCGPGLYWSNIKIPKGSNKFDAKMEADFTGTAYRVEEVAHGN